MKLPAITRSLAAVRSRRRGAQKSRLSVESLEDRRVLATFTVNSLGDSHDANPGDGVAADSNGLATLRAAVEESNALASSDVINFAVAGTILLTQGTNINIADDLEIDGGNNITVDAGGTHRVFDINDGDGTLASSTVTLRRLTVTNGQSTFGGGILNDELTTLDGVQVSNNRALQPNTNYAAFGGGILNQGSMLIVNSTITGNRGLDPPGAGARAFGGGIANYLATASLTIRNSIVSNNISSNSGGGIFSRQGYVRIADNSIIDGNRTGTPDLYGYGGGIAIFSGSPTGQLPLTLLIESSTISGNSSVIDNNPVGSTFPYGGGIYAGGFGSVVIRDSVISGNSATGADNYYVPLGRGGGAFFSGFTANNVPRSLDVDISRTSFDNNYAISQGGAIGIRGRNYAAVNVEISDSTVTNNTAGTYQGGAFFVWGFNTSHYDRANMTVRNTTITGNEADNGGVSMTWNGGNITFEDSTLRDNVARDFGGGAIFNLGFLLSSGRIPPHAIVRNSTISGNGGLGNGGGIFSYDADLTVYQSTISGNQTSGSGGGIYLATYSDYVGTPLEHFSTINRSTITNNNSDTIGGGIHLDYYHLTTISNTIVSGNSDVSGLGPEIYGNPLLEGRLTFSLIENNTGTPLLAANPDPHGNIIGTAVSPISAQLGPLADNGGNTFTHLPGATSPAINAADPADGLGRDQRGFSPRNVGGQMDMGSVEVGAVATTGDFNNDGLWDCADINALSAEIASGGTDLSFDMNADGVITIADITDPGVGWLAVGGANNPAATGGNPFLRGDANLSGAVDGSDFGVWNANKFTSNSAWCSGDFTADGAVDGSDFGVWNSNKFQTSDSARSSKRVTATNGHRVRPFTETSSRKGAFAGGAQGIGDPRTPIPRGQDGTSRPALALRIAGEPDDDDHGDVVRRVHDLIFAERSTNGL